MDQPGEDNLHNESYVVANDQTNEELETQKKHVCEKLINSFSSQMNKIHKKMEIQNDNIKDIRRVQHENQIKHDEEVSKIVSSHCC